MATRRNGPNLAQPEAEQHRLEIAAKQGRLDSLVSVVRALCGMALGMFGLWQVRLCVEVLAGRETSAKFYAYVPDSAVQLGTVAVVVIVGAGTEIHRRYGGPRKNA